MARYKLKLKQLDFVSLVDDPAQPNAKCLLIKRSGDKDEISATARLVKTSNELGLAFFWAFTSTNPDGSDHYDLHSDQVLSDNEMIKAAAEFMEKGGAVDEMHDGESTGHVVFAMPMTPEIASAYGVTTKTSGLMVAIRPSADAMAKLKSGEYTAVSIAGIGERVEARKSRVAKASLYTTETDGHAHVVCVYEDGSLFVQHATMAGAEYSHSHGIVLEAGKLTILADSGHSHELAEGQPGVAVVPADAIVVVQARRTVEEMHPESVAAARSQAKSTRHTTEPQGESKQEGTMPTEHEKQIADLTKRNERLDRIAKLSGAHKTYFDTLTGDDADAFLAKSTADRESIVQKALEDDKPIWIGEVTKVSVRKRDGELALQLAKQNEHNTVLLAKQADDIEKAEVRKLAVATLGKLAGGDDVHDFIIKAVRRSGDAAMIEKALAAMKGWNAESRNGQPAPGVNPGTDAAIENPQGEYDTLVTKAMSEHKVDRFRAADMVLATGRGQELYAAINKRK